MKMLALFILLAVPSLAHAAVETKTDRFSGATTTSYEGSDKIRVAGAGEFKFSAHRTKSATAPAMNYLFLIRTGPDWRYLSCESTYWLLDGKPFALPKPDFKRDTMRGGVIEGVIVYYTDEQLAAMANASSLEVKICNDEIRIPDHDLQGIREVYQAGL